MNAERLLAHFERISEAPDAIARLRRFILDLAVRGKLVEQDPEDEPAEELLYRIQEQKKRMVLSGVIKKPKEGLSVSSAAQSPQLPQGWSLCRLDEASICLDYKREPVNGAERHKRIEGKLQEQLFPYFGATQQQGWIDDYLFDDELVLLGEDGVPFFDALRAKAYVISGKTWVNNHAHVFKPILSEPGYLVHCLNVFDYSGRVAGATRSKLNQAKAVDIPIPLPPLAEQYRIVAKANELMALCDQLEAARQQREQGRERLMAATLQRLNQPADDLASFRQDASFALEVLPNLTTTSAQIKQLRQTILNLAVRGKLVEQDPEDEDKTALARLIEFADESCSLIPESWLYVPLTCLLDEDTRNGYSRKPDDAEAGFPILRISAGTARQDGLVDEGEFKLISGIDEDLASQYAVKRGDLLACRFNGNKAYVGRLSLFMGYSGKQFIYPDKLIRVRLSEWLAEPSFFRWISNSDLVREEVEEMCATTVGNWGISAGKLKTCMFPLPPLAEQHRIVAKVDELMALCDQLEQQLNQADQQRRRLLEAVLAEALVEPEQALASLA